MIEISHRVGVFVYGFAGSEVRYLLVRARPRVEAIWGPIVGPIRPAENPEKAVRRRVREEIGLEPVDALLDLRTVERTSLGDLDLIDWPYGCRVGRVDHKGLLLAPDLSECCWEDFAHAYGRLEFDAHRRAMMRLHLFLNEG